MGKLTGIHFLTETFEKNFRYPISYNGRWFRKKIEAIYFKKPKPLMNIGGNPLLDEIIKNAQNSGINKIYISVNYMKKKIFNHIKKNRYTNLKIVFLNEKKPLGTAGPLKFLQNMKEKNYIITNGDVFTGLNFLEVLKKTHSSKKLYYSLHKRKNRSDKIWCCKI